jgi:hypothetical protein
MDEPIKTRRGVYLDLTKSPYVCKAYGLTFRFSSRKKMGMFNRDLPLRIREIKKLLDKINSIAGVTMNANGLGVFVALQQYKRIEGK